jgi:hypothetical protein
VLKRKSRYSVKCDDRRTDHVSGLTYSVASTYKHTHIYIYILETMFLPIIHEPANIAASAFSVKSFKISTNRSNLIKPRGNTAEALGKQ